MQECTDVGDLKLKICTKCKISQPLDNFYKNKQTKLGIQSWCKNCHKKDAQKYKERNREYLAKKKAEWDKNNRLKTKEYTLKRRALLKGNKTSTVSYFKILDRDGYMCHICNSEIDKNLNYPNYYSLSFDHVIPLSKNGEHSMDNIRPSHLICNNRKGDR
jgi:5-methylcytosine-specific restriction endonuclease McrA